MSPSSVYLIALSKTITITCVILFLSPTISSLQFKFREENSKGKFFINKTLYNLKGTKVIAINNIGVQRIYNLTAQTTHTYLSNGFISSNTGLSVNV